MVCGSLRSESASPERLVTIGLNDVGRGFDRTYLVVPLRAEQFRGDRFPGRLDEPDSGDQQPDSLARILSAPRLISPAHGGLEKQFVSVKEKEQFASGVKGSGACGGSSGHRLLLGKTFARPERSNGTRTADFAAFPPTGRAKIVSTLGKRFYGFPEKSSTKQGVSFGNPGLLWCLRLPP